MIRLLNTEPSLYSDDQLNYLEKNLGFTNSTTEYQDLKKVINLYNGLLVGLNIHFDSDILKDAGGLKFIATPTTGLTHLDLDFLHYNNIEVISLKGEKDFLKNITSTAEHAWLLLLACARDLTQQVHKLRSFNWDRYSFMGNQITGKSLGIIGLGRVGKMIAAYGDAFGMTTSYYDPHVNTTVYKKYYDLDQLLTQSDFVVITASYDPKDKHLISGKELSKLKQSACLINIARGELLDTEALLKTLMQGKIAKVALDVIEEESSASSDKFVKSKLLQYALENKSLIITPHIGGVTHEAREMTNEFIIKKIERHLRRMEE